MSMAGCAGIRVVRGGRWRAPIRGFEPCPRPRTLLERRRLWTGLLFGNVYDDFVVWKVIPMSRRPSRTPPVQPTPQVTAEEIQRGIDRLAKRLADVSAFEPASVIEQNNIPHVEALAAAVDEALTRTFGADTLDYKRYSDAAFFDNGPFNISHRVPIQEVHASLARSKARSIALLTQAIETLEERLAEFSAASPSETISVPQVFDRKVFVVHGHDEGAREAIARFLERIGFEAIILHEQANQGRTVIEKVETHGDVGFVVVLLTPDDEGAKKGESLKPRARQNVVLELGYFIGRLGRERVCALKRGDIEIPSDFGGVVYSNFDEGGGWRQILANELQAAGFEINWNQVMRP
jgi:predicted nucleotide-binding protein